MTEPRWTRVAKLDEIPEERGLAVEISGEQLALFRDGEQIHCLEDSCPHRGAGLSEGTVRNGEVVCPWHGWRYGLCDGECSTLPGSMPATIFATRVDGEEVFVDLASKERPRPPQENQQPGNTSGPSPEL